MGFNPTKFRNVAKNDIGEIGNLALRFFEENSIEGICDINDDSVLLEYISNHKKADSYRYDDSHYVRYILYVYNNGVLNKFIKDKYIHHDNKGRTVTLLEKGIKQLRTL